MGTWVGGYPNTIYSILPNLLLLFLNRLEVKFIYWAKDLYALSHPGKDLCTFSPKVFYILISQICKIRVLQESSTLNVGPCRGELNSYEGLVKMWILLVIIL